ncbi:hypothetical protein [Sporosarcina sp. FSL K6-3508]
MEWFNYATFVVALLAGLYSMESMKRNKELEERVEELEKKNTAELNKHRM